MDLDLEELAAVIELLDKADFTDFRYEKGDLRIEVRRGGPPLDAPAADPQPAPQPARGPPPADPPGPPPAAGPAAGRGPRARRRTGVRAGIRGTAGRRHGADPVP